MMSEIKSHTSEVRTRFAPSPTGFMHIGNLRTALFEYLVAKSMQGTFVLRIEDTDQSRYVEGALDKIYQALDMTGLGYDEGPGKEGDCGPYVQSERKQVYMERALELVEKGKAYRCFCTPERLESLKEEMKQDGQSDFMGYDRHCRNLSQEQIEENLAKGLPFVIRQKMPLEGETSYEDAVFGTITVQNETLEDQILIKSDGFPTYNFANVIDDHDMRITHVVRGSEYLSSTPKYVLLYEAFGYEVPTFVHLPLINGKDGKKLSKRHGATSLEELVDRGYLPEAIVNYLALLGWSPSGTQEMFSLEELKQHFSIKGIQKAPAVFDEDKLLWFNQKYIQAMDEESFHRHAMPFYEKALQGKPLPKDMHLLHEVLSSRTSRFTDLPEMLTFLREMSPYENDLYFNKKMKTTPESTLPVLVKLRTLLDGLQEINKDNVYQALVDFAKSQELKNGQVMGPLRVALTGLPVSPGGSVEAFVLLGKEESLKRLDASIAQLEAAGL